MTSQPTAMPRAASRAREPVLLGRGEHGRDDHGAGVHRAAFERVVVVLAVRRGAVAQRGGGDVEAAGMTDDRARAGLRRSRAAWRARSRCCARPRTGRRRPSARRRTSRATARAAAPAACRRTPPRAAPRRRLSEGSSCLRGRLSRLRSCWRARRPSSARSRRRCTGRTAPASSASRSAPRAAKVSRKSGEARILLISALSLRVMASGILAGPTMPYQVRPLKPS